MKAKLVGVCLLGVVTAATNACASSSASQYVNMPAGAQFIPPASLKAEKVIVYARAVNWEGGPEADGLRVWLELQDAKGKAVAYVNSNMAVKLDVMPSTTEDMCEAGIALFTVNSTLKDSRNDVFGNTNKGIKDIAWDHIDQRQLAQPQKLGMIAARVTLPDGKQIDGFVNEIPLKP